MGIALVISAGERANAQLRAMLELAETDEVRYTASQEAARAQLGLEGVEVAIIVPPLPGADADQLAAEAARLTDAGVILVVQEWADGREAEAAGAMLLKKPVSQAAFIQAVRHARASHRRTVRLNSENARLHVRLDEVKLVSRAKLLLMKRFSMSEEQAHHHLEKRAMQERITLAEAAKSIVANCEP